SWGDSARTRTVPLSARLKPNVIPAGIDTSASFLAVFRDSVQEFWFEPSTLRSVTMDHLSFDRWQVDSVLFAEDVGSYNRTDGILGAELLMGQDLEFDRIHDRFAMYAPVTPTAGMTSMAGVASDVPLTARDCVAAHVVPVDRWRSETMIRSSDDATGHH